MPRKLALIIGISQYSDPGLPPLKTPGEDASDLAEVLRDAQVGQFDDVAILTNESLARVQPAVADFFADKKPDDLLLLYFSGHGVLDERGRLYLALANTIRQRLSGTALPAAFLTDEMDNSRSRRQVLILDCCHSGAFARGTKAATGAKAVTQATFEGLGYGRTVLTASDATQYAWEGDQIIGEASNSIFTHFLVEGLRSGLADTDSDGRITLDEWYDFVYEAVISRTPKQTPGKWSYKQQGELLIARNPHPLAAKPAELPLELRELIESPIASAREAAVRELSGLLSGSVASLNQAAHAALQRLAEDDSHKVALSATAALAAYAQARSTEDTREERTGASPPIPVPPPNAEPGSQPGQWASAGLPAAPRLGDNPAEQLAVNERPRSSLSKRWPKILGLLGLGILVVALAGFFAKGFTIGAAPTSTAAPTPSPQASATVDRLATTPTASAPTAVAALPPATPGRSGLGAGTLAFLSDSALRVTGAGGLGPPLATGDVTINAFAWSPDGTRLAFSGSPVNVLSDIYVITVDGSNLTRLTDDPANDAYPVWSPDGSRIAFLSTRSGGDWQLFVMRADGSQQRQLTADGTTYPSRPSWSSDSRQIAVAAAPASDQRYYKLFLVNADGSGAQNLTPDLAYVTEPLWSPDGRRIAFVSSDPSSAGNTAEIYVTNADGSGLTRLTHNSAFDNYAAWSPDSQQLAFASDQSGSPQIYVINADGTRLTQLTNNSAQNRSPAWSPDSQRIAFVTGDLASNSDSFEIYLVNADGSGLTRLTEDTVDDQAPAWKP